MSARVTRYRSWTNTWMRTVSWAEGWEPACWFPKTDLNPLDKYSIFVSLRKFIRRHARDVAKCLVTEQYEWRSRGTAASRQRITGYTFSRGQTRFVILLSCCLLIYDLINLDTFDNSSLLYKRRCLFLKGNGVKEDGFSKRFALFIPDFSELRSFRVPGRATNAIWDAENEWRRTTFAAHS